MGVSTCKCIAVARHLGLRLRLGHTSGKALPRRPRIFFSAALFSIPQLPAMLLPATLHLAACLLAGSQATQCSLYMWYNDFTCTLYIQGGLHACICQQAFSVLLYTVLPRCWLRMVSPAIRCLPEDQLEILIDGLCGQGASRV